MDERKTANEELPSKLLETELWHKPPLQSATCLACIRD